MRITLLSQVMVFLPSCMGTEISSRFTTRTSSDDDDTGCCPQIPMFPQTQFVHDWMLAFGIASGSKILKSECFLPVNLRFFYQTKQPIEIEVEAFATLATSSLSEEV